MKSEFIAIIIFLTSITLNGQNTIENILSEIEKNNTGLLSLKKKVEADKLGNRTGIFLSNPEVGFNYLYGKPSDIGNRTDISIIQAFDFPTAYAYKDRIADSRSIQAELEYQKQLKNLLYQAHILCIDLVHANILRKESGKRLQDCQGIAAAYKARFDKGETGILEYNKAQLNLLNVRKTVEDIEINRLSLLSELATLNGGVPVTLYDTILSSGILPDDFEKWYIKAEQNNPALSWLNQEIKIIEMQKKLNIAMSLPKISAGYMSEKVVGQHFQGITAGLSIPLWENKNIVKYEKAHALAVQSLETDSRMVFYNQLRMQFNKVKALGKMVSDYRISMASFDNSALLKKSLDQGEISLSEYFYEISIFYESISRLLEAEKDFNKAVAALEQYSR